jgi:hypothetical protein
MPGPPPPPGPPDQRGPVLFLLLLVMVALLTVAWALGKTPAPRDGVPLGPVGTEAPSGSSVGVVDHR